MRILLVEDDKRTSDYISNGLTSSGHVADALKLLGQEVEGAPVMPDVVMP